MAEASAASLKSYNKDTCPKYLSSYCAPRRAEKGRGICYCVLAYSPNDFYIVTEADMIQNLHFTQQMEQLYQQESHFLDESQLTIGTPVAARYVSGDLAWYRAKLVSLDEQRGDFNIEFVDYAHTQTNTYDQLRAIPAKIAEYPPMALHCRLYGLDKYDWNHDDVNRKFCEIAFKIWNKGKCLIGFLTDKAPYVVRMWNVDTAEEMTPEMLGARRLPSPPPQPKSNKPGTINTSTGEVDTNCDLLLLSDGGGTGARLKTTVVKNNDISEIDENKDIANNFGFLGDFIKKLKLEMPVESSAAKLEMEKAKASKLKGATEKSAQLRDAAVQTAYEAGLVDDSDSSVINLIKGRFPLLAKMLTPDNSC